MKTCVKRLGALGRVEGAVAAPVTADDVDSSAWGCLLTSQHLTKSRYTAGLQRLRRLWLIDREPAPYEEAAPGSPLDIGREIGRKAHLLFSGGALVDEEPWRHAQAVGLTAAWKRGNTFAKNQ